MSKSSAPSPLVQIWPVIHLSTSESALAGAEICARAGCEGVFVISMDGRDEAVGPAARAIKRRFPELRVGINLLGSLAPEALRASLGLGLDATWTDAPGVGGAGPGPAGLEAARLLALSPAHLFFGSVAFKYQAPEPEPGRAAMEAAMLGMIPTTSGAATGSPPSSSKLRSMRVALGSAPLALASGVDPQNVAELGAFLTHALVSTGVSKSFHEFDPALLALLMSRRPRAPWRAKPVAGPLAGAA